MEKLNATLANIFSYINSFTLLFYKKALNLHFLENLCMRYYNGKKGTTTTTVKEPRIHYYNVHPFYIFFFNFFFSFVGGAVFASAASERDSNCRTAEHKILVAFKDL